LRIEALAPAFGRQDPGRWGSAFLFGLLREPSSAFDTRFGGPISCARQSRGSAPFATMTKVLVFESDHAFAGELRSELGRLGCSVQIVDDGNVGLQVAQSERPDLILLSIELPRMNGFSVCNKLKKDSQLKDVPLLIMSSESSDETFEQHRK